MADKKAGKRGDKRKPLGSRPLDGLRKLLFGRRWHDLWGLPYFDFKIRYISPTVVKVDYDYNQHMIQKLDEMGYRAYGDDDRKIKAYISSVSSSTFPTNDELLPHLVRADDDG